MHQFMCDASALPVDLRSGGAFSSIPGPKALFRKSPDWGGRPMGLARAPGPWAGHILLEAGQTSASHQVITAARKV
ncbi:MAG TPA: hypothetical protein GXX57_03570 [Firmicutes bacterium]|nr:hypothetical protein [Bacillota bacterium]